MFKTFGYITLRLVIKTLRAFKSQIRLSINFFLERKDTFLITGCDKVSLCPHCDPLPTFSEGILLPHISREAILALTRPILFAH